MLHSDFLIIGAGIVGVTIARELKLRHPYATVTIIEKEAEPGRHSSVRNSGVLHSGIYYPPNSLKAKVCRQGSRELADYCLRNDLPLDRRGKVLVATNEDDDLHLDLLAQRAKLNGVDAEIVDEKGLLQIEPEARSKTGKALWIPSASVGSPKMVMDALVRDVVSLGVNLSCNAKITSIDVDDSSLMLNPGRKIRFGHVINAAGLHADCIAHLFGVGRCYTLLPFKGIYWKINPNSGINIRRLIYPVPDLRMPFLGIHTTTSTDGVTYLGPTAIPVFGRENYHGIQDVSVNESFRIMSLLVQQLMKDHDGFRRLALREGKRYFKPWFFEAVLSILRRIKPEHLEPSDKVGIRAQMLNKHTGRLVADFLVERGPNSTHILNAISPAWTSSFAFSRHVCDNYIVDC